MYLNIAVGLGVSVIGVAAPDMLSRGATSSHALERAASLRHFAVLALPEVKVEAVVGTPHVAVVGAADVLE